MLPMLDWRTGRAEHLFDGVGDACCAVVHKELKALCADQLDRLARLGHDASVLTVDLCVHAQRAGQLA